MQWPFPLLATLAVIGIIYGALVALAQTDIKRLVAYSSVSHMGFIVLGMFALNSTGLDGSVIQMVNHGLTTGPFRLRGRALRALSHARDDRAGRNLESTAAPRLLLHPLGARLGRLAGPQWIRGRVSDPGRACSWRAAGPPCWRGPG